MGGHSKRRAAPSGDGAALHAWAAVSLALILPLSACASPQDPEPTSTQTSQPLLEVTGLAAPWSIAFFDRATLLSERDSGRILEVTESGTTREVAALDDVVFGGEGGLLGIAVRADTGGSPDSPAQLYAYSTGPNGNRVQRFALEGSPGALSLGATKTVIDGLPSAANHNGGRIAFGPDGMLYATVGDAAQSTLAQDPESLAGKILRLTPEGRIPPDNPFPGSPVYSLGHRNPQGIAWAADGTMYASEFGQDTWDELNVIMAGANYGWPVAEGIARDRRFTDPVQQWATSEASPSGIAIVEDTIYIANLRGERLRTVPIGDLALSTDAFVGEYGRLRDVALAPDGRLWALTNNTDGRGDPRAGDDRLFDTDLRG